MSKLNENQIALFAERLDQAAVKALPTTQLSLEETYSEEEAYAIQAASLNRRYDRGEAFVGVKMGFTSTAKMEQMGVSDLIWGRLTDKMLLEQAGVLDFEKLIHPRAEPEICFRVAKEIDRELSESELAAYIDGVAPAIEIIDSRYENFKFSLEDVIADNCSSAALVLGEWSPVSTDLSNLKIELVIDGEAVQSGSSAAILDDPWKSVLAATRLAEKYNQALPAGSLIMAGAATSAVFLQGGQKVEALVEELGAARLTVS